MGMCIITFLSSWGMHSKIAVAFSPNSLTFHLYLICYLLSLSESFLHCCSLSCSPVFYFCLLSFSAPWEKCLAFIHFQPQIPGLNPMSWTLQIFLYTLFFLPFASNMPHVSFPSTKLVWFFFSSALNHEFNGSEGKDG